MLGYLFQRLLLLVPVLAGVAFVVVAFLQLTPGDPVEMMLDKYHGTEQVAALRERYAIYQEGLFTQFAHFVTELVQNGDFGVSVTTGRPVREVLAERFPATIELAVAALVLATAGGVALGVLAARTRGRVWDALGMTVALLGVSVPIFWLAILAVQALAVGAGWFPVGGRLDVTRSFEGRTGFYLLDAVLARRPDVLADVLRRLALPASVLATVPMAIIARLTRTELIETLGQDHVRTARAKGLGEARVTLAHGLRNALVPIGTAVGTQFGYLLGGAVLTETLFDWPGMGRFVVESVLRKDFPAIQGGVFVMATAFVLANLAVDLSYAALDPRLRRPGART